MPVYSRELKLVLQDPEDAQMYALKVMLEGLKTHLEVKKTKWWPYPMPTSERLLLKERNCQIPTTSML